MSAPVVAQRWREKRDLYRPVGEVIRTSEYDVAAIDETPAKAFVLRHHYSTTCPAIRFRYGLYRRSLLVGVAIYSHPMQDSVLTNVFPTGSALDSVELGRFVLLDEVPANGETWFLARTSELLHREPLVGVVSFSDPVPRVGEHGQAVFRGHIGTIYQARSAVFLGRATPRTLRLFADGTVFSARARQKVRSAHDRKRGQGWQYVVEQLLERGAAAPACFTAGRDPEPGELHDWLARAVERCTRAVRHPGNFRYAWPLRREGRRMLAGRGLPYPKLRLGPVSMVTAA